MSATVLNPVSGVPDPVTRLADVMSAYPATWALCGGWAVDAWLGGTSRDHGDVDLSVFDADHEHLARHLANWQLIAHDSSFSDGSTGVWDGRRLPVPSHIHARAPEDAGELPEDGVCQPEKGWWLDIQIDGRGDHEWVLRHEPRVALPIASAVRLSPWGVPTAAPEALLFFKAMMPRRRDWRDFVALLPHLHAGQCDWLRQAIARLDPEHPWIAALAWAGSRAG